MVGNVDGTSNDKWLVKSGEKILGPYSTEALIQLVRDKDVVVIDEVMSPRGRWTYLRDVKVFESAIEEIRRSLMQSREDTEVQGYTDSNHSRNESANKSGEIVSAVTDPHTMSSPFLGAPPDVPFEQPERVSKIQKPLGSASPPSLSTVTQVGPVSVMTPRDRSKDIKAPLDATIRPKAYVRPQVGSKTSVYIGSAVLFLAAGFIIFSVLNKPVIGQSMAGGSALETQASVAWKRGEFERALELYRALDHQKPGEPMVASRLAVLMMKIEGQTVAAKRVIESAEPNASDADSRAALAIAKGLAELQSDDAADAVTHFESAGSSWIAKFNAGVARASLKKWSEAVTAFEQAGDQAVALLMLAQSHLGDVTSEDSKGSRQKAEAAIKKALVAAPDFAQESLVVGAYVDATSNQLKRAASRVHEAIETDPNQTADHFHDPSLSLDGVSWTKLLPLCRSIHASLQSRESGALVGLCLAKANQLAEANKALDAEIGADPNNSYVHAVNAYLHLLADREDAARASLMLSSKNGSSRLAQILSSRLCMNDAQYDCAEDGWSKLASEPKPPIASITGLAQVRKNKGDVPTANALLVKADSMSPSYLPLLRLREDASR